MRSMESVKLGAARTEVHHAKQKASSPPLWPERKKSILLRCMMSAVTQRRVARALRAGGPEVIEVGVEDLPPLEADEVLVRVEAAGLNHAETLILSGNYVVRLPFPWVFAFDIGNWTLDILHLLSSLSPASPQSAPSRTV